MPPEGIEIVQRSPLREKSGSMQFIKTKEVSSRSPRRGNWSLLATFSGWKTFNRKSSKWWASPLVIQHNFHGLYLSQGKEKLLLKVVYVLLLLYPDWIKHEKNFTVVSPSEWTSTVPVVETSESIEPNDNNLKLSAIGYIFSKIF